MKNIKNNEIIINKSRFLGFFFEIEDEKDVKDIISNLQKEHKKATHFCFACRGNNNGFFEKCSDDGEPSGTAGKPILNVLQRKELLDVALIVVRYFGGVKLGAGGLLRAYSKCASELVKSLGDKTCRQ